MFNIQHHNTNALISSLLSGVRPSLTHVGLLTLTLVAFCHKALTYLLVYPLYRLLFGTLYPAYASYKAVKTKNVKEYVSRRFVACL